MKFSDLNFEAVLQFLMTFYSIHMLICKLDMQISVCRKYIVFQNSALYYAAILKFENYAFVSLSELFKLKLISIQVYAKKLSWR